MVLSIKVVYVFQSPDACHLSNSLHLKRFHKALSKCSVYLKSLRDQASLAATKVFLYTGGNNRGKQTLISSYWPALISIYFP